MSFEDKMKKRGNKKLNQFAKNPYHKSWFSKIPTWSKILVPSLAVGAAVVVFVSVGVLPNMSRNAAQKVDNKGGYSNDPQSPTNKGSQGGYDHYSEPGQAALNSSMPPKEAMVEWDDKTAIQQYPECIYQDNKYQVRNNYRNDPLDPNYVQHLIADSVALYGYDGVLEENHQTSASLYNITKIDPAIAVAVKFVNTETYYAYINKDYYFETIEDMLNKVSFNTEVVINGGVYREYNATSGNITSVNYLIDNQTAIMDYLYTLKTYPNTRDKATTYTSEYTSHNVEDIEHFINLYISIPALNIGEATRDYAYLYFYSNGDVAINLFGRFAEFNIGTVKYQEMEDILLTYPENNN